MNYLKTEKKDTLAQYVHRSKSVFLGLDIYFTEEKNILYAKDCYDECVAHVLFFYGGNWMCDFIFFLFLFMRYRNVFAQIHQFHANQFQVII